MRPPEMAAFLFFLAHKSPNDIPKLDIRRAQSVSRGSESSGRFRLRIGNYKENAEDAINDAEHEVRRLHAFLRIKHEYDGDPAEFFQHGWNHERPQSDRVARDD